MPLFSRRTLLAATGAVALGGCTGPRDQIDARPSRYVESVGVDEIPADQQDLARSAASWATTWALSQWLVPDLLDPEEPALDERALTAGIVEAMTPGTARVWTDSVRRALAGDQDAMAETRLLRFHTWDLDRATLPVRGEVVQSQAVTELDVAPPRAATETYAKEKGVAGFLVSFQQEAKATLAEKGRPYDVILTKPTYLGVAQEGDGWRIVTYRGNLEAEIGEDRTKVVYADQ